jgi:hypothetical protein
MVDINPQKYQIVSQAEGKVENCLEKHQGNVFNNLIAPFKNRNLIIFLVYFALWGFAVNLSTPFFNLYMLKNLSVDITWVTLFSLMGRQAR